VEQLESACLSARVAGSNPAGTLGECPDFRSRKWLPLDAENATAGSKSAKRRSSNLRALRDSTPPRAIRVVFSRRLLKPLVAKQVIGGREVSIPSQLLLARSSIGQEPGLQPARRVQPRTGY